MNRIVKEHYPASKLPEDLRQGVDPAATVTVTIVEEQHLPERRVSLEEIFAARRPPFRSADEIDADLRRQRDEWDD
jgi:uncharacterized protein (UPF0216 family)